MTYGHAGGIEYESREEAGVTTMDIRRHESGSLTEAEPDFLDRNHARMHVPKDMPAGPLNALPHVDTGSDATGLPATGDMPADAAPAGIDGGLVRSLLGLLCMLLGVVGVVIQIILFDGHILPPMSPLWHVSVSLGVIGLVSIGYDWIRILRERTSPRNPR